MTHTLFVSSIEDSTGKTGVALALAQLARERGQSVGYMKPKGTRLRSHVGKTLDDDPMLAHELLELDAEIHELEPIVYSPTFIEQAIEGREDPAELREEVSKNFDRLAADRDLMLVEGGGRLTAGGIVDLTDADIAELFDAEVLLVAEYTTPADLDDVLAAVDTLGDCVAGVLFNSVARGQFDQVESTVVPFLESSGVPVLGVLPREQELAGITVADLATQLSAERLTNVPLDAYVERFVVGAMGGDRALRYFRRTKDAALITGGDRSDLHTVALEAPGIKCLILTGGFRPSQAVIGAAEEKGVPILLVQSDTLATVDSAEEVVRSGRVRDERTVELLGELLFEHADVDAILASGDAGAE